MKFEPGLEVIVEGVDGSCLRRQGSCRPYLAGGGSSERVAVEVRVRRRFCPLLAGSLVVRVKKRKKMKDFQKSASRFAVA